VALRTLTASFIMAASVVTASSQSWKNTAPESFNANGQILGSTVGVASAIDIKIERYTSDADHTAIVAALKSGGHPAFVEALRKASQVGTVTIGDRSVAVRWARQQPQGKDNRRVAVVTDQPLFFFGGGAVDAKPTAGFDVALIEFTIDMVGLGKGTMAPAARLKPGGPIGVEVEDYAGQRVTLTTVRRNVS
jgi:hypothetical protein